MIAKFLSMIFMITSPAVRDLQVIEGAGFTAGSEFNSQGSPVVNLWQAGAPTTNTTDAGFRGVPLIEHEEIFHATTNSGGYNHHAQIASHAGRLWVSWSNSSVFEEATGERILFSSLSNGVWTSAQELFSRPDPEGDANTLGFYLVAQAWVQTNGTLYGVATLYEFLGWKDADGDIAAEPDETHIYRAKVYYGRIAREVSSEGLGDVFSLSPRCDAVIPEIDFTMIASTNSAVSADVGSILSVWGNTVSIVPLPDPLDNAALSEPAVYQLEEQTWAAIIRDDKYSHRKYLSVSEDAGDTWTYAFPTDIPDSPSDTYAVQSSGKVLMFGNFTAQDMDNPGDPDHYMRAPLILAVSTNGLTFHEAFAVKGGEETIEVPLPGLNGGAQYPRALVETGVVHVVYSLGKQNIGYSTFPEEVLDYNPPLFSSDPLVKANALEGAAYTGQSIAGDAQDADGDTLTFSVLSGPAWLNVSSNGVLSGTPASTDVGTNQWVIEVTDGLDSYDVTELKITVNGLLHRGEPFLLLDLTGSSGAAVASITNSATGGSAYPYRNSGSAYLEYGVQGGIQFEGAGASDTVLRFDNTLGNLTSGDGTGGAFTHLTVELTLYMYDLENSLEHDLVRSANNQFYIYRDQDADSGEIRFSIGGRTVHTDWVPVDGQQYDLTVVFNGNESILFYVDGVLIKKDTNSSVIPDEVSLNSSLALGGYLRTNETTDRYDTSQMCSILLRSEDLED